jgi:hypothetical protein
MWVPPHNPGMAMYFPPIENLDLGKSATVSVIANQLSIIQRDVIN